MDISYLSTSLAQPYQLPLTELLSLAPFLWILPPSPQSTSVIYYPYINNILVLKTLYYSPDLGQSPPQKLNEWVCGELSPPLRTPPFRRERRPPRPPAACLVPVIFHGPLCGAAWQIWIAELTTTFCGASTGSYLSTSRECMEQQCAA
ncbi:hypothetical protein J6590_060089 [Homalodisca vitripennis]|nr:hypothetical protein J6590_060089 [Homalodisca vitripennis]